VLHTCEVHDSTWYELLYIYSFILGNKLLLVVKVRWYTGGNEGAHKNHSRHRRFHHAIPRDCNLAFDLYIYHRKTNLFLTKRIEAAVHPPVS
jgi:hypothetical protein